MHRDTSSLQGGPGFISTIRHIDIITLIDTIIRLGISGDVQQRGPEKTLHCFFQEGHCFYIGHGDETASTLLDFLSEIVKNHELQAEILKYARVYPLHLADALESAGIQLTEGQKLVRSMIEEGIFWSVLFSEGEIVFLPAFDPIMSFSQDQRIRDIFLGTDIGQGDAIVREMRLLKDRLDSTLAFKSEKMEPSDSIEEMIMNACIDGSMVRRMIQRMAEDAWLAYQKVCTWSTEGLIEFRPHQQEKHVSLPGTEPIIGSLLEVYRGVFPLLFESRMNILNDHEQHVFDDVLRRVWSGNRDTLETSNRITQLGDFFTSSVTLIDYVAAPEKLVYLRQHFHSVLVYLLLELRTISNEESYRDVVSRIRGFLAFIKSTGTFEQKEVSDTIGGLLDFLTAVSPGANVEIVAPPSAVDKDRQSDGRSVNGPSRMDEIYSLLTAGNIIDAYDDMMRSSEGIDLSLQAEVCSRALSYLRDEIGARDIMVQLSPGALSHLAFQEDINDSEGFLLSRLDSRMSIGDLVIISGMNDVYIYRFLLKFKQRGFIQLGDAIPRPIEAVAATSLSSASADIHVLGPANRPQEAIKTDPVPLPDEQANLSQQDECILRSLKQEYHELSSLPPHEIFKLGRTATKSDFEQSLVSLRNRYRSDYFSPALRETVQPILHRIMTIVNEAAAVVQDYFRSASSQPVQQAPPETSDTMGMGSSGTDARTVIEEHKNVLSDADKVKPNLDRIQLQHSDRKTKAIELQNLAMKARSGGDFKAVIDYLQQALQLTPENFSLHRALDDAKLEFNSFQASELFEQAKIALQEEQLKRAAKLLQEALEFDEANIPHIKLLAQVLAAVPGRSREAIKLCMRILQSEPGNAEVYLLLGRIYKAEGKLIEARGAFQEALRWNAGLKEARIEFNSLP